MSRLKHYLLPLGGLALALVVGVSIWLALTNQAALPNSNGTTASDPSVSSLTASADTEVDASNGSFASPSEAASETRTAAEASASSSTASSQTVRGVNKPEASGPAAPNVQFVDELGNAVSLASKQGKPTIVNLWASWCPPCREEMPYFLEAYQQYGDRVNFVMLNATGSRPSENAATAQAYLQEAGLTALPIYYDSQRQSQIAFKAVALPTTVVLDAEGRILQQGAGGISRDQLFALLDQLTQP